MHQKILNTTKQERRKRETELPETHKKQKVKWQI